MRILLFNLFMNGLLLNVQRRSSLFLSLMCAAYFLLLYTLELKSVAFAFGVNSDSICYLQSGLHGMHVICALIFVGTCYLKLQATSKNNLSLHFGAWYWHFVDLSWLIVWIMIYMLPYIVVTIYSKQDSNNLANWDWVFEPMVMNGQRFINLKSAISFHLETAKLSDFDKIRLIKYLLNLRPFGKTDESQIFLDSAQFGDNSVGFYVVQQQHPINRTVISMIIEDTSLISRANYLEKKISNLISRIPEKKLFYVAENNIDLKNYLNLNSLLNMKGYMFFHYKALFTERKLSFIETYVVTKGELHVVSYFLNQNDPFDPTPNRLSIYTNYMQKLFINALLYLALGTNEEIRMASAFSMGLIACEQVARFCFFFFRFYAYVKFISIQYPFAQMDQLNFFFSPETHACLSGYAGLVPEDNRSFEPLPLESLVVKMENILKLLEDCEESQNIFDTWYWLYP